MRVLELVFNETTQMWEERTEPFITIEIETEEDYEFLKTAVEYYGNRENHAETDKALEWLKGYAFKDSEEVYTNGAVLVPLFRVEQALKDKAYNGLYEV